MITFFYILTILTYHDFHLSKSEVNINSESTTIQIATNIFIDDLEAALEQNGHTNLKLATEKEDSLADKYVSEYLFEKFRVAQRDSLIHLNFIGKEFSEDLSSIWCYFESDTINPLVDTSFSNQVLFELFDDQKNVIVLSINGKREHFILEPDDHSIHIDAIH